MTFLNTTSNILKIRNSSNGAFTEIGNINTPNLGLLSAKGSLFVTRPTLFSYIANRAEYDDASYKLYSRIADGRLKVAIHDKMPLEKIVEAHNLLEGRKTKGAIVITL